MPTDQPPLPALARTAPPLVAAVVATVVSRFVPLLGPLLLALVLGAVVANTAWSRSRLLVGHASVTRLLLRLGVVLVGLRLPIGDIGAIGVRGVAVVAATVCITFAGTRLIGRRLGLDHGFVTLVATGFSICGAAAIAAVTDAVRVRQRDVALAVAMVTLFGSGMIIAVPWLARSWGLSQEESAIWAGASIHEVAQVVAAASLVGTGAVAVATTVKLGRVALLAPTYALAARGRRLAGPVDGDADGDADGDGSGDGNGDPAEEASAGVDRAGADSAKSVPVVPWFLVGFLVAVAVRSTGILPGAALSVSDSGTNVLLAAGMFGLGLGFRLAELWPAPRRALALAVASTVLAATASLCLILALYR
ncbi:putative sulfate exporter family transporter [Terrabacter terrae]|uniref:Sulfate exporter family transporter n=1 Tax=Terrabacter terrae TaxID=318434 RepID=A0ABN2UA12_9MICO